MKKALYIFLLIFLFVFECSAKTIIRDAEIERYIKEYSERIFKSAGLPSENINIALIEDESPNAFVAGGMNIFIHTGLINMCDTPEELIGVIAHETGHISGGHLARLGDEVSSLKTNALYSLLLATAIGIGTGNAEAGTAVLLGSQETNKRNFLHYSRTHEAIADQNALRFLDQNHISSIGLLSFMKKLEKKSLLPASSQPEYLSTHPLSKNRIDAIESHQENTNIKTKQINDKKFNIIKDKLAGYITPRKTIRKYKDENSFEKKYALAIAHHRTGDKEQAIDILDQLIKQQPRNPYLYELKGQILRENGEIESSLTAYQQANRLIDAPLIKIEYARTIIDLQKTELLDEAIQNLLFAIETERNSASAWQLLAISYKRLDKQGEFRLASAEADLLKFDLSKAIFNAKKADGILSSKGKNCQRCKDIIYFIEQKSRK